MSDDDELLESDEFDEEDSELETADAVAAAPNEAADPVSLVERLLPASILEKYEAYSYRNAALILTETHRADFQEILDALEAFSITTTQIRKAGGSKSDVPKNFSLMLEPKGWLETSIRGDLLVRLTSKAGKKKVFSSETVRERYLDGHQVDYVKNRVAFDLEWNSKDQTFDRDLYAFSAFAQCGVIDAGIVLTRSAELNEVFRSVGPALDKNGKVVIKKDGTPSSTISKYGASTTWMGKLLYRLNAGRNGGCPVLALGIRPKCVSDWSKS